MTGAAALQADMTHAGDSTIVKITIVTFVVIITMPLFFYRSIVTVVLLLLMVGIQLTAARGSSRCSATTTSSGYRRSRRTCWSRSTIAAGTDYADLPHRALSRGALRPARREKRLTTRCSMARRTSSWARA